MKKMRKERIAILITGMVLGLLIASLLGGRYELMTGGSDGRMYKIDTWTGKTMRQWYIVWYPMLSADEWDKAQEEKKRKKELTGLGYNECDFGELKD